MNHIYRLIWNIALGGWTVASEHTKGRGKRASAVRLAGAVAAVVLAVPAYASDADADADAEAAWALARSMPLASPIAFAMPRAEARATVRYTMATFTDSAHKDPTLNGNNSLILGSRATLVGSYSVGYGSGVTIDGNLATAVGTDARAEAIRATAYGAQASAQKNDATALGYNSLAKGSYAIAAGAHSQAGINSAALGSRANASGAQAVAVGYGSVATENYTTAVGFTSTASGYSSVAVGAHAASAASHSIAIGDRANVANAALNGMALGRDSKLEAAATNAVALGYGSVATSADTVSVGNTSLKRKIVNVADGALNAASTDAVTGKQLFETNAKIIAAAGQLNGKKIAIGQGAEARGSVDNAIGYAAIASGTYSNAMGYNATTAGSNAVAIGTLAKGAATSAVSLGNRSEVAAAATNAVALGSSSSATAANTVSVGNATLKRKIVNVADGALDAASTEAVTGKQLFATDQKASAATTTANAADAKATSALLRVDSENASIGKDAFAGNKATAVGAGAKARGSHSNAIGFGATSAGNNAIAVGVSANATAGNSIAIGNGANVDVLSPAGTTLGAWSKVEAGATNSVALGSNSVANVENTVSVGNSTRKRKIVNVGDGLVAAGSNEAVTGNQLHATNTNVTAATNTANTAKSDAANALTQVGAVGGLIRQTAANANVRIGAENTGTIIDVRNKNDAGRKLSGVADGVLSANSTEAVTGKQLHATDGKVTAADNKAVAAQTKADKAGSDAATALTRLASAKTILGIDTVASGSNANAMGARANAAGSHSNAIGYQASTAGANAVGFGTLANAAADEAIAMGNRAIVDAGSKGGTALGAGAKVEATAGNSIALGAGSVASAADTVSVGTASKQRRIVNVADGTLAANSRDAVTGGQLFTTNEAIKSQQTVVADNTRLIGANRVSIDGNQTAIGDNRAAIDGNRTDIDGNRGSIATLRTDLDVATADLDYAVMFNKERTIVDLGNARISGLAAGDISRADSRDAVNGGQLFATNTRVGHLEEQQKYVVLGTDEWSELARAGLLGVAIGDSAEASLTTEGGTAIGSFAKARATNSVALGRSAAVGDDAVDGFALGGRSAVHAARGVALGAATTVEAVATNSVALGYGSVASEANTISVGTESTTRRIVNVAAGTADGNAATVAQLKGALDGLGGGATVDATGRVTAPQYVLSGTTYDNVGTALVALDSAVVTTKTDVDSLGSQLNRLFQEETGARSDGAGRLALGGTHGMVLGNVADGRIAAGSRDAVNGGQLHATNQKVGENRSEISDLRAALDGMQPRAERSLMAEGGPVVDFGGSRLAGVGAGDISSADSKDAVNGGQLFATNARVGYLEDQQRYAAVGSDEYSQVARAGWGSVAIGDTAEASVDGEGGTAVGSFSRALADNSVALGRASYVQAGAVNGFALGTRSNVRVTNGVALGADTEVRAGATNGVALGYGSITTDANSLSVGSDTMKRRIVNVAAGTADHNATTVAQLKGALERLGGGATVDASGRITAPEYVLSGTTYDNLGTALLALDSAVVTTQSDVDTLGSQLNRLFQEETSARSDGPGRLILGGAHGMVLGNVANGLIAAGSRDAVNGGQLYEVQKNLQGQIDTLEGRGTEPVAMMSRAGAPVAMSGDAPVATSDTGPSPAPVETPVAKVDTPEPVAKADGDNAVAVGSEGKERSIRHVAKGTADTDAVNVRQLNDVLDRANEYTDLAVEGLNNRLDGMDKRFNRMAAMSSAQSAMAMNTAGLNTYNRLGAGVGHSDGESALAVGYQRVMNERGSATFSLNGAFTNSGEKTVGVGVGIGW